MSDEPVDPNPDQPKPRRPRKGKLSSPHANAPYEVGKGKPPVEHRFKPGNKGGGRPKNSKNRAGHEKLLDRRIVIGHDARGRAIRKTYREVIDLQLLNKAAKGDLAAIKILKEFEIKVLALRHKSGPAPLSPEEARREALEREEKDRSSAQLRRFMNNMLELAAQLKKHGLIEIGEDGLHLSSHGHDILNQLPVIDEEEVDPGLE